MYAPPGKTAKVKIGDKTLEILNPGVRWVLATQQRCRDINGNFDPVAYAEAILNECVVSPKGLTLDDFAHEDEIIQLLRSFREIRRPTANPVTATSRKEGKEGTGAS